MYFYIDQSVLLKKYIFLLPVVSYYEEDVRKGVHHLRYFLFMMNKELISLKLTNSKE